MHPLTYRPITCPYCGEPLEILINGEEAGQQYIEDCQVCCRPMTVSVAFDEHGELSVSVHDENEAF